jgi:hypothetical protein
MFKKMAIFVVILCCFTSVSQSQTLLLTTKGISLRDAARDTTDIFDRAFNGLLNVGIETKMYLEGKLNGARLTNPSWMVSGPLGSAAIITATFDADTSTQIAVLTPDVAGTYVVNFTDGTYSASVTINAGTYLGAGVGDGNCVLCHQDKAAGWNDTNHSKAFFKGLEGLKGDHFSSDCIRCHTTGFDEDANNNGFDDFDFVFPDSLFPGMYDSMKTVFPDAMKRANVQCESCHGPGSNHFGVKTDSKMVYSLSTDVCAWCHDAGTHHVYPEQWDYSGHANPPTYPTGPERASCARCHTPEGFIEFVEGKTVTEHNWAPFSCAMCHDPHSHDHEHQLRTVNATLSNGEIVTKGGTGKLCMNCHQSRREANSYSDEPQSHFGPHYMTQADIFMATNVVTFGKTLPSSPHISAITNLCVDCHMYPGKVDDAGNVLLVGSHTWEMHDLEGNDNVAVCADCHGDIGDSFEEKKYYLNGNADHDGDGVEEGVHEEVEGLMDILASMLPKAEGHEAYDPHDEVDTTWTKTELKAAYNYEMVYYDRSHGIHNPAFIVALLKVSIQALLNNAIEGEIVAIEDVPNDQGKLVRIIWDKFVDDGVAVDPVFTYLVKRYDGDEIWTGVGQHPADKSKRYALIVPTLYDSTDVGTVMSKFKIVSITRGGMVHESMPGEGYSVDNLVPHAPGDFMAILAAGNVELRWEQPVDPDINYYKIYRSDDPAFTPDETNKIGTTVDLKFIDRPSALGKYYYIAAAVDFSGNLGEFTRPVSATLTSVDDNSSVPFEYALSQNYPNPFNPETSIKFSLKQAGRVILNIFNSTGQIVKTLVDQDMSTGSHNISFIADGLTSGVYFYRIMVTNGEGIQFEAVRKMILMK